MSLLQRSPNGCTMQGIEQLDCLSVDWREPAPATIDPMTAILYHQTRTALRISFVPFADGKGVQANVMRDAVFVFREDQ